MPETSCSRTFRLEITDPAEAVYFAFIFVAGGIALPPLRSVIWNCLDPRDCFTDITVVYGARRVADMVYKNELEDWDKRTDMMPSR